MALLDIFRRKKPEPQDDPIIGKSWVSTDQGWMNPGWSAGWWQENKQPIQAGYNATVEACVLAYAQAVAMCPIKVIEDQETGEERRVMGTVAERVLNRPNSYQTRALFMVDICRSVLYEGNAYAVVARDERGNINQIHVMNPRNTRGVMASETGDVFYYANPKMNQPQMVLDSEDSRMFPARDVFHLRMQTGNDALLGVTPLSYAINSVQANTAIIGHQASFHTNQRRPSGILSSDQMFTADQLKQLQERFDEKAMGMNSGGVPVLGGGLKFQPMSLSAEDAQLVESYRLTVADISRVFRVPLPLINDMTGATYNNTEMLMKQFLQVGLGFMIDLIELEFTKLFGLDRFGRRVKLDEDALIRMDMKSKSEAYGQLVKDSIMAPDEAREKFGMPPVPGGHGSVPRAQLQSVPLDKIPTQEPAAPEPTAEEIQESIERHLKGAA